MIDPLKLPRTIPGLGDNLLTVARPAEWDARVKCILCGEEQGCRVVSETRDGYKDTMDTLSFNFWIAHFQSQHPGVLPEGCDE